MLFRAHGILLQQYLEWPLGEIGTVRYQVLIILTTPPLCDSASLPRTERSRPEL